MSTVQRTQGPWFHRFLIRLFSVIQIVLSYWLLGFFIDDLIFLPEPSLTDCLANYTPVEMTQAIAGIENEIAALSNRQQELHKSQSQLNDSTANYERTMRILLIMSLSRHSSETSSCRCDMRIPIQPQLEADSQFGISS